MLTPISIELRRSVKLDVELKRISDCEADSEGAIVPGLVRVCDCRDPLPLVSVCDIGDEMLPWLSSLLADKFGIVVREKSSGGESVHGVVGVSEEGDEPLPWVTSSLEAEETSTSRDAYECSRGEVVVDFEFRIASGKDEQLVLVERDWSVGADESEL